MKTPNTDRTEARPWGRALCWLAVLAPVFFLTYGFANHLASQQAVVPSAAFPWESAIPFIPWSIVPYWSIDVLYALSVLTCNTGREVDTQGRRLLTAQLVATACFILFPLTFTFDRPEVTGIPGILFVLLEGFDQPFNQAPSLHIALLVIIWARFAKRLNRRWHLALHVWSLLIAASVLTTYQHHFIDVPTGALLGLLCLWLWPDKAPSPVATLKIQREPQRLRLGAIYLVAALTIAFVAIAVGAAALWLFWPAVSLLLVSLAYLVIGEAVFQKSSSGRMSVAARLLMGPYLIGAWINSRLWTIAQRKPVHVADNVWISRFPSPRDLAEGRFDSVVDLSAELPRPTTLTRWSAVPSMDLVAISPRQMRLAAQAIERQQASGSVLVCCALGYSRSVSAVAAWLLATGRVQTVVDAVGVVEQTGRRIVLGPAHMAAIKQASAGA